MIHYSPAVPAPDPASPAARRDLCRVVLASLIGTSIEWYDFFLYGTAAALVFNKLFFPSSDPLTGTLLAYTTYALGFIARPIGGALFGHFGDLYGRKRLLLASLITMGASTTLIGLLPTYGQVGLWAPVLLLVLRLVQGFAIGGEWGGAVLLVAEHGSARRRGFWTSWPQIGVPLGNLLAAGVLAVMAAVQTREDFLRWGWRVPFLLSACLLLIGAWLRSRLSETSAFEAAQRESGRSHRYPVLEVLREKPWQLLTGAALRAGENVSFYILTAFSLTYIVQVRAGAQDLALKALALGCIAECLTLPLFAAWSDRIGRRGVYLIGALCMAAWIFCLFVLINQGSPTAVTLALVVGLILHGAMYGPQAAFLAELFPTRIRYSGLSICYQVTSILAGSLAPIIALTLYRRYESFMPVACYVAVCCLISALAAFIARESSRDSLSA